MSEHTTDHDAGISGEDGQDRSGAPAKYGRRTLMLGAAAGAGAIASLISGAAPADAASDNPVELGESNTASASTVITTSGGNGLNGVTTSDENYSCGLLGQASSGMGVYGTQSSTSGLRGEKGNPATAGVVGDSGAGVGVLGLGNDYGVYAAASGGAGVYGIGVWQGLSGLSSSDGGQGVFATDGSSGGGYGVYGQSEAATGVYGYSGASSGVQAHSCDGTGLLAESYNGSAVEASIDNTSNSSPAVSATTNGTGPAVLASNTGGIALQVEGALHVAGVATFSRSGVATVSGTSSKSATSIEVTGVSLSSTSTILATAQVHIAGVGIAAVVPDVSNKSFTIYLTKAVKVSMEIAWFRDRLAQTRDRATRSVRHSK